MTELKFPTIYLLPTHIDPDELPELESRIPSLTYDINEARIILGKINTRKRAIWELQRLRLPTVEITKSSEQAETTKEDPPPPPTKRPRTFKDSPVTREDAASSDSDDDGRQAPIPLGCISVVKLEWFLDSVFQGVILPMDGYTVYQGRKEVPTFAVKELPKAADILKRAKDDTGNKPASQSQFSHGYSQSSGHLRTTAPLKRPALMKETTSEHDIDLRLPPIPDFLHTTYSCQRPTPFNPPNDAFIEQLKQIRTIRALEADKIGVRAYSTSIAALAAYPHLLTSAHEVARLPGCGEKIAELFHEWKNTNHLQELDHANKDPKLSVLRSFYEIWGVAETTAREFYNKGWRDLDDIVEYGWSNLSRVQQIGVKYYDEFSLKIPRAEVESIGNIILEHSNKLQPGFQMVIVGGYRRGKQESGDVDVVISHPDQKATYEFVEKLVMSLEKDKHITHTLTLSTKNSERGQAPLQWKGEDRKAGSGFDTLDKALVVWQDPMWDRSSASKNPNPHRRVDIIIAPWKTAGCAVIGWSGGTTFQRDLRRYCKKEKALKFDSSGIRSRVDGTWVDLESDPDGRPAPDMLTAEKRVFQGLGLTWRPPEERNTG